MFYTLSLVPPPAPRSLSIFPTSAVISGYILNSKGSEVGSINNREQPEFIRAGLVPCTCLSSIVELTLIEEAQLSCPEIEGTGDLAPPLVWYEVWVLHQCPHPPPSPTTTCSSQESWSGKVMSGKAIPTLSLAVALRRGDSGPSLDNTVKITLMAKEQVIQP